MLKTDKTRKRAEAEARVWEKVNDGHRSAAEAAARIRVKAEAKRSKRERSEAEARAKDEAVIKEKLEKMSKVRE